MIAPTIAPDDPGPLADDEAAECEGIAALIANSASMGIAGTRIADVPLFGQAEMAGGN